MHFLENREPKALPAWEAGLTFGRNEAFTSQWNRRQIQDAIGMPSRGRHVGGRRLGESTTTNTGGTIWLYRNAAATESNLLFISDELNGLAIDHFANPPAALCAAELF